MHRTSCNISLHAFLNFLQDRSAVGSISKPDDREHYRLLKGSKGIGHNTYIVGLIWSGVNPVSGCTLRSRTRQRRPLPQYCSSEVKDVRPPRHPCLQNPAVHTL